MQAWSSVSPLKFLSGIVLQSWFDLHAFVPLRGIVVGTGVAWVGDIRLGGRCGGRIKCGVDDSPLAERASLRLVENMPTSGQICGCDWPLARNNRDTQWKRAVLHGQRHDATASAQAAFAHFRFAVKKRVAPCVLEWPGCEAVSAEFPGAVGTWIVVPKCATSPHTRRPNILQVEAHIVRRTEGAHARIAPDTRTSISPRSSRPTDLPGVSQKRGVLPYVAAPGTRLIRGCVIGSNSCLVVKRS